MGSTSNDVNNDAISSAGFISRGIGRLPSRNGKEEVKEGCLFLNLFFL
jgi:hypothetical protein